MSAPNDAATELLTEHLQYTPANLLDEIIDVINLLVQKSIDSLELGLLSTPPAALGFKNSKKQSKKEKQKEPVGAPEERAKYEIENGAHQLETLLETTVDKNFDKMEIYAMRNIFNIPPELCDWIRLAHYEGLNFTPTPDAPDEEKLRQLRRTLQETQKLHKLLLAEEQRNAAIITNLRALLSTSSANENTEMDTGAPFAFLQERSSLGDGRASKPLGMTTSFVLSQLPSLKALLSDLRPRMGELAQPTPGRDPNRVEPDADKSFRRARLEYVETQTRKYLENVRGLELGPQGEVVDGEWQGDGRRLAKREVEDLERVVQVVRGEANAEENDEAMDQTE